MKLKIYNLLLLIILINNLLKLVYSMDCHVDRFNKDLIENKIKVALYNSDSKRNEKTFSLFDCKYFVVPEKSEDVIKCKIKTSLQIKCDDFLFFFFPKHYWTDNEKKKYREKCECRKTKYASLFISENNEDIVMKDDDKRNGIIILDLKKIKDTKLIFNYIFNNDEDCLLSLKVGHIQYVDCLNISKYYNELKEWL